MTALLSGRVASGEQARVASDDDAMGTREDWIDEPELFNGRGDLRDLLVRVGACVPDLGNRRSTGQCSMWLAIGISDIELAFAIENRAVSRQERGRENAIPVLQLGTMLDERTQAASYKERD